MVTDGGEGRVTVTDGGEGGVTTTTGGGGRTTTTGGRGAVTTTVAGAGAVTRTRGARTGRDTGGWAGAVTGTCGARGVRIRTRGARGAVTSTRARGARGVRTRTRGARGAVTSTRARWPRPRARPRALWAERGDAPRTMRNARRVSERRRSLFKISPSSEELSERHAATDPAPTPDRAHASDGQAGVVRCREQVRAQRARSRGSADPGCSIGRRAIRTMVSHHQSGGTERPAPRAAELRGARSSSSRARRGDRRPWPRPRSDVRWRARARASLRSESCCPRRRARGA